MTVQTKWLPDDYLDEVIPEPQESPSDVLFHDPATGAWCLIALCDGERDPDWPAIPLTDGAVVGFSPTEFYGDFEAVIGDDGALSVQIPAKASHFGIENDDAIFFSLEEVETHLRSEGNTSAGDVVVISAWWWGDSVPHRLVIEGATARFEVVQ